MLPPIKPKQPTLPGIALGRDPDSPDGILEACIQTWDERNQVYRENWRNVGPALAALYPDGVCLTTASDHGKYQLATMILAKLSRFACSGHTHRDSAHDIAVYAAMLESLVAAEEEDG